MLVLDEGSLGSYRDGRVGERAGVLLVLVSDSTRLLRYEPQEQLRILASILERAASGSDWETEKLANLRVLFQCEPEEADGFVSRLNGAGANAEKRLL